MSAVETSGQVHQRIAELSRDLHSLQQPAETAAQRVVDFAATEIPGAQYASVTLAASGRAEIVAVSDPIAAALHAIQGYHRQGPGRGAAVNRHTIRVDDLETETRWPHFCQHALRTTPVRSLLSFQLFTPDPPMNALNVYANQSHAFTAEAEEVGYALATHSGLALDAILRNEQFHLGLESRDIIGQAKGIVMARFTIDADAAFELLKRVSQSTNTRVIDVARKLAAMKNFDDLGGYSPRRLRHAGS